MMNIQISDPNHCLTVRTFQRVSDARTSCPTAKEFNVIYDDYPAILLIAQHVNYPRTAHAAIIGLDEGGLSQHPKVILSDSISRFWIAQSTTLISVPDGLAEPLVIKLDSPVVEARALSDGAVVVVSEDRTMRYTTGAAVDWEVLTDLVTSLTWEGEFITIHQADDRPLRINIRSGDTTTIA